MWTVQQFILLKVKHCHLQGLLTLFSINFSTDWNILSRLCHFPVSPNKQMLFGIFGLTLWINMTAFVVYGRRKKPGVTGHEYISFSIVRAGMTYCIFSSTIENSKDPFMFVTNMSCIMWQITFTMDERTTMANCMDKMTLTNGVWVTMLLLCG